VTNDPRPGSGTIVQRRLRTQRLVGAPFATPEEAVGWLGGVQAQDLGPAKWSVGRRVTDATDAQLQRAYAAGSILRTHVLRATWHFVLPDDIRLLLTATAPRILARTASRYRQLGLDRATLEQTVRLLADGLAGSDHLTRGQVGALLTAGGIDVVGQRLPHILMHAELSGVVCSGTPKGAQNTYALLDERAPQVREVSREQAAEELTLRYFTGHGPATAKDLATWATLTMAEVGRALEAVGGHLRHELVDGIVLWSADAPSAPDVVSPTVHLLQGYDEYVMGYFETKHVISPPGSLQPGANPPFHTRALFLDGLLAGSWTRTVRKGSVTVHVAPDIPLTAGHMQALEREAGRYGEFFGLETVVSVS
jgi:hypothetical protein